MKNHWAGPNSSISANPGTPSPELPTQRKGCQPGGSSSHAPGSWPKDLGDLQRPDCAQSPPRKLQPGQVRSYMHDTPTNSTSTCEFGSYISKTLSSKTLRPVFQNPEKNDNWKPTDLSGNAWRDNQGRQFLIRLTLLCAWGCDCFFYIWFQQEFIGVGALLTTASPWRVKTAK